MPDLVGDDLVVRVLHHKADPGGLLPLADLFQGRTIQSDGTGAGAMGGEDGFQVAQQGGLSTAGGTAEQNIFPRGDGQAHIRQGGGEGLGIGEGQILDMETRHAITSLI